MLPTSRSAAVRRLLSAGLVVGTLLAAVPATAQAAPVAAVHALAEAGPATPDQKLAVAVKFGNGDNATLLEKLDRDFVIGLWNLLKDDDDHLEVTAAAELAFSATDAEQASYEFIATGVFAAFDRDIDRETAETEDKQKSDTARAKAALTIDVVADSTLLDGTDADFVRLIWERVAEDAKWPKVKAAARAAREGSDEDRRQFIAAGMAAAAKQDVDDRILADESRTEAQKQADLARTAKRLAANRIGLTVTDELLELPDQDFVIRVWNNTPNGSEVQAAAIAAVRRNDPAVCKAFIDTGLHEAVDRDAKIALEKLYQADRLAAQKVKETAVGNGDLNLAYWATKALDSNNPDKLFDFLRKEQFDLDLRTSFETGDVQPTWTAPVNGTVVNVANPALVVGGERGHTGSKWLAYSGTDVNIFSSAAYLKTMALSRVAVKPTTTLSYWIFPQSRASRPEVRTRNSTCVTVDLIFSDGSNLRDSGATDQYGTRVHPQLQCSKLVAERWNQVVVPLGAKFADKTVTTVVIGYDQPANGGGFRGFLDDLTITDEPVAVTEPARTPVNYPVDPWRNDFNSDGNADVFARAANGELFFYRGNGRNGFLSATPAKIGAGWNQFDFVFPIADFNGDKFLDIAGHNTAGELKLYPGNGKGGWNASTPTTITTGLTNLAAIFSPGDFNGDKFADVITVRKTTGDVMLYRGNGKGGLLSSTGTKIDTGWHTNKSTFSPFDFDGDGFSDILARYSSNWLNLEKGSGRGTLAGGHFLSEIGYGSPEFSAGDFDGDGLSDLLYRSGADLMLKPGDGAGHFVDTNPVKLSAGWSAYNLLF